MAAQHSAYETDLEPADQEYRRSVASGADDRQFAITLAPGMDILRCFTAVRPVMSNAELAEQTGLSRPTISRFTYPLSRLGYLRNDPATGRYPLGPAVISLGYPLLASLSVRQTARPMMNELARATRGSVSMGIRDRLSIVYVETSRASAAWSASPTVRYRTALPDRIDRHRPCLCSRLRAECARCLLNEIRVHTPDTRGDMANACGWCTRST